jgi:hypothetical protein
MEVAIYCHGRFNLKADFVFLVPKDIEYPVFRLNQQYLTFVGEFILFPLNPHFTISPFIAAGGGVFRGYALFRSSGYYNRRTFFHSDIPRDWRLHWVIGATPDSSGKCDLWNIAIRSIHASIPQCLKKIRCRYNPFYFAPFNSIPVKISVTIDY